MGHPTAVLAHQLASAYELFCIPTSLAPHHPTWMGIRKLGVRQELRQERAKGFEPSTSSLGSWPLDDRRDLASP